MKIYDISQEIFTCVVYPGDPAPERKLISDMNNGEMHNLTGFSMCAHNGTHIDAPRHFISDGAGVDEIRLEKVVGDVYVTQRSGLLYESDVNEIIKNARRYGIDCVKKILIKGDAVVSADAAHALVDAGIELIGTESQSVGPANEPMVVHKILLARGIVLLEGIRLGDVVEGKYFLFAAPLNLAESDGAPCRALLINFEAV